MELQTQKGGQWQTNHSSIAIGEGFATDFAPASVHFVRLNILEATDMPTIWEVELFEE